VRPVLVSIEISAPAAAVWDYVKDISTHPEWMRDAVAIRFTSPTTTGVGTAFECDTRIGPFRLTDHMEVTEWRDGDVMAIRHVGIVTGHGRFTLTPTASGGTRFEWAEELEFPARRGGRVTALLARPVLKRVWRGNLKRLRDRVESR
jgi:uncharacterized protein YndB with AHSA1/START domain